MQRVLNSDPDIVTWWATRVECVSALARRARSGESSPELLGAARLRFEQLAAVWREIEPNESLRASALALLERHQLRAADALQLAAAMVARSRWDSDLAFVTLDLRLAEAASAEAFVVLP
jgi:predicted nucleic acid-binding protein